MKEKLLKVVIEKLKKKRLVATSAKRDEARTEQYVENNVSSKPGKIFSF